MRDKILEYVKSQEQPHGGVVDIPGKGPSAILTAGLIPTLIGCEESDFAQRCATWLVAKQRKDGAWPNHNGEIAKFDIAFIARHLNMAYNAFAEDSYADAAALAYEWLLEHETDGVNHFAGLIGGTDIAKSLAQGNPRTHHLLLAAELLQERKRKRDRGMILEAVKRVRRPDGLVAFDTEGNGSDIAATAMLGVLDKSLAPDLIRAIEPWVNDDGSLPVIAGTPDKSAWVSKFVLDLYKAAE